MSESAENQTKEDITTINSNELIKRLRKEQEGLRQVNEELAVAEEELRVQNEELLQWREELEHLKQRYLNLFNEAPDGYLVTDTQGRIQEANESAAHLFGCATEKLTEFRITDLLPVQIENFLAELSSQPRSPSRWEGFVLPISGKPFWSSITCSASRSGNGRVEGLRWLIRDVTDRKRINDALAESESRATTLAGQLRELASELTLAEQRERQRIAQILHDHIQQMLVAAKMQAGALMHHQSSEDRESAMRLICAFLDQALAESRSLTAELSPPVLFDLGLASALQWLAKNMLENNGLQVEVSVGPSFEMKTENTAIFLFDAVREILFNVVKHAGVHNARVVCLQPNDSLFQIVISDEGKGFDPTSLKRGEPSRGLGLFSIQQRLKHMGGLMEIDTAPGDGTRITLIMPRPSSAQKELAPEVAAPSPDSKTESSNNAAKIRVILADDHHIIRNGLARILQEEVDIEVVGEASNGAQAINLARSLRPDIIIMDANMPVLTGIEATAEILRDMPNVKIVGLSMYEDGELSSSMRQAGAVAYVTKGGSPEALVKAIRRAAAI